MYTIYYLIDGVLSIAIDILELSTSKPASSSLTFFLSGNVRCLPNMVSNHGLNERCAELIDIDTIVLVEL